MSNDEEIKCVQKGVSDAHAAHCPTRLNLEDFDVSYSSHSGSICVYHRCRLVDHVVSRTLLVKELVSFGSKAFNKALENHNDRESGGFIKAARERRLRHYRKVYGPHIKPSDMPKGHHQ